MEQPWCNSINGGESNLDWNLSHVSQWLNDVDDIVMIKNENYLIFGSVRWLLYVFVSGESLNLNIMTDIYFYLGLEQSIYTVGIRLSVTPPFIVWWGPMYHLTWVVCGQDG